MISNKERLLQGLACERAGYALHLINELSAEDPSEFAWREGYNEAVLQWYRNISIIKDWLKSLPEDTMDAIIDMFGAGEMEMDIDADKKITLEIRCNDTFMYACGDSEDVTIEDIPEIYACYKEDPNWGALYWVCKKRNLQPMSEFAEGIKMDAGSWDKFKGFKENPCR